MKWLLNLLTSNEQLPKPVKVFVALTYGLWAIATTMVLLGWFYEFIKGTSDVGELVEIIMKLF